MEDARNTLLYADRYMTELRKAIDILNRQKLSDRQVLKYIDSQFPFLDNVRETQKKSGKGLSLLLFVDARAAQNILDESFTSFGWRRTHQEIGGRLYCTVAVWDGEKVVDQQAGREDGKLCGKGERATSDSFKRACFNWGIG